MNLGAKAETTTGLRSMTQEVPVGTLKISLDFSQDISKESFSIIAEKRNKMKTKKAKVYFYPVTVI